MITAVVLSHNDEAIVKKTLDSLAWCDEVVVVDDYSEDGTREVAKKSGACVVQHHVNGDFAAQRNFGLSQAKGDWVLFVDSDEIVSNALRDEIGKAIEHKEVVGYFFKRQDYMYGRPLMHGETGSVRLLRLGKKEAGRWTRPVHEVWDIQGQTGKLVNPLLHYPHATVKEFLDDINTYSALNAQYLYTQKVKVPGWHIIAYPLAKFVRNYIVHAGFLDGTPGAIMAIMMSFHSFLTRAKLYMLWHKKDVVV